MAKKKRNKRRRVGRVGVGKGEHVPKRRGKIGANRRIRSAAGIPNDLKIPIGTFQVPVGQSVWDVQDALRRQKFFARAVGPSQVATNAPIYPNAVSYEGKRYTPANNARRKRLGKRYEA